MYSNFTISIAIVIALSATALPQPAQYQPRGTRSYLVNYGAVNGDPFLARFGARRFVLFDESSPTDIRLVHAIDPTFPILHYKDIVALHPSFSEFAQVNRDESAFVHSSEPSSLSILMHGDTASLFWLADRRALTDAIGYRIHGALDSLGPWGQLGDSLVTRTSTTIRIPKSVRWLKVATNMKDGSAVNYGLPVAIQSQQLARIVVIPRLIDAPRDTASVRITIEAASIGDETPDSVVVVMDANRDNTLDTLRERTRMSFDGVRYIFNKTISISGIRSSGGYEFFFLAYKNKQRSRYPASGSYGTNANNRVMNDYYAFYVMDVGSSRWRRAYIDEVMKEFTTQGYNGLFEDDCWYKIEPWGVDAFPSSGYTDAHWKKSLYEFLDSIKISIAPRPAYFNGLYAAQSESLLVHADGGMNEGFAYTSWSGFVTGEYWKTLCNLGLRAQHHFGKTFLALGGAPGSDTEGRMYVLGSYLLITDSLSLYANANDYQTFAHYPEFDIPLGAPLESAKLSIDDLKRIYAPTNASYYVRRFEHGMVVVNPDPAKAVVIDHIDGLRSVIIVDAVSGPLTTDGGRIESINANDTVKPHQAKVYLFKHANGNTLASPLFVESKIISMPPNSDGSIPLLVRATLRDDSSPVFRSDTTKPLWVVAHLGMLGGPKELRLTNDGTATPGALSEYSATTILPVGTLPVSVDIPITASSTTGLIACTRSRATLPNADAQNLVLNFSFEIDNDDDGVPDLWRAYGKGFEYDTVGLNAKSGRRSIHARNDSTTEFRGTYARIVLNQTTPRDLFLSGWSKAANVSGAKDNDYSLYIDIRYNDDTPLYGQTAQFNTGTHDWQYASRLIHPTKPVKDLSLYALFRRHTGEAWFDHIALRDTVLPNGAGSPSAPASFALGQNRPNPFTTRTEIEYSVSSQEHVAISVFDVFGRRVATLVDASTDSGSHTILFDGAQIPSGVYYYRLVAGGKTITKKMTLVK